MCKRGERAPEGAFVLLKFFVKDILIDVHIGQLFWLRRRQDIMEAPDWRHNVQG